MGGVLLTPSQVAERFQVTEETVKTWLREGKLKGFKVGRLWRIRPEAVNELIEAAERAKEGSCADRAQAEV